MTLFSRFRTAGQEDFLTDAAFADSLFSDRPALLRYLRQQNEDRAMEDRPKVIHVSDDKAAAIAAKLTGCDTPEAFRQLDKAARRDCVVQLRQAHLSIVQIARLTGIPSATVGRIVKTRIGDGSFSHFHAQ